MIEAGFARLSAWTTRHRRAVLAGAGLLIAVCAAAATQIRFDNDIAGMMPADPALRRDFSLIRENAFTGKAVLSFELVGSSASLDELARYADRVAARLPGPLVTGVIKGPSLGTGDLARLLEYAPQLADAERLQTTLGRMTRDQVDAKLRAAKLQLLSFQGMFVGGAVRADPLGLFAPELGALQGMAAAFGRNVTFTGGHFAAQDGRHVMLILETPVPVTDGPRARRLLAHIADCLRDRPAFARVDVIAGHTHAVANESLIKQDIARTGVVATVAFLVVLIWFFRDWRAGVFFLIPALAILVAMVSAGLVFGRISALVVALSTVIIGIADDYGIHVYTAVRTSGRRDVVLQIARPIVLAALFTSSIFLVFFFSSIPGYHQLAWLTITSIWLCVGFVLLVFPHLITLAPLRLPALGGQGGGGRWDWRLVGAWALVLLVCGAGAVRMKFSTAVSTLDGVSDAVRAGEKRFEDVWLGGQKQGVLVAEATSLDAALALNRAIFQESAAVAPALASFAPFGLPESERAANALAWTAFWQSPTGSDLRTGLAEGAARQGFAPAAFAPFMALTRQESFPEFEAVPLLKQLSERFISRTDGKVRVFTFFPEEPEMLRHFERLTQRHPDTFVFSETAFERRFSASINREAVKLAGYAVVLLALVAAVFLRQVRLAVIALSAAVTSVLAVTALFGFLGRPLTAPALVALMIAVGLSINYGISMLYSLQHDLDTGSDKAIAISAATTLIGALSLLAARHPALFSIGVSLSMGLGAGWLCAETVIPALHRLFCLGERRHDAA